MRWSGLGIRAAGVFIELKSNMKVLRGRFRGSEALWLVWAGDRWHRKVFFILPKVTMQWHTITYHTRYWQWVDELFHNCSIGKLNSMGYYSCLPKLLNFICNNRYTPTWRFIMWGHLNQRNRNSINLSKFKKEKKRKEKKERMSFIRKHKELKLVFTFCKCWISKLSS